jgi:hypothetical protein
VNNLVGLLAWVIPPCVAIIEAVPAMKRCRTPGCPFYENRNAQDLEEFKGNYCCGSCKQSDQSRRAGQSAKNKLQHGPRCDQNLYMKGRGTLPVQTCHMAAQTDLDKEFEISCFGGNCVIQ